MTHEMLRLPAAKWLATMNPLSRRRSMTRQIVMFAVSVVASGCYAEIAPHPAPVPLPPLSEEALIGVHTQHRTVMATRKAEERVCPADVTDKNSPKCTV